MNTDVKMYRGVVHPYEGSQGCPPDEEHQGAETVRQASVTVYRHKDDDTFALEFDIIGMGFRIALSRHDVNSLIDVLADAYEDELCRRGGGE